MRRRASACDAAIHPLTSAFLKWMGILSLCSGVASPLRAQQIDVSPLTVPLDGTVTVTGAGLFPGAFISLFWDHTPQSESEIINVFFTPPAADGNGSISFTIGNFPSHFYQATAGPHTLTFLYPDFQFQYRIKTVTITLTPRQGWNPSPPLSTQASPQMTGGTLAFLRSSADNLSTSLIARDGEGGEKVLGTAAVGSIGFGQPEWSPDGSRIAFSALFDTFPHRNLYILDVASGSISQATPLGGTPPHLTGGGTGSVSGSIKPYIYPKPTSQPDEGSCLENDDILQPKGGYVSLIGANRIVAARLPEGAKVGDPMPFQIDGVPEGDYSLHMWHYAPLCQETTRSNPNASQPGQKPTLVRHSQQTGTPNLTVSVHVTAGQATQLQALQVSDLYTHANTPSWITGDSLVYTYESGTYALGGNGGLSDIYTVTPGQEPVKRSDTLANGLIFGATATPAKGLIAGVANNTSGLFFSSPATFPSTLNVMTNWQAVLWATNNQYLIQDMNPAWDPTGNYVAFVRMYIMDNLNVGNLWIHDVSTGIEYQYTDFNLKGGIGIIGRPAWSPDGKQVAVTYSEDDLKTFNIRVYNVADASFFAVTNDGRSAYPSWRNASLAGIPENPAFNGPPLPDFTTPTVVAGDVNADGQLTVTDAVLVLKFSVNIQTPSEPERKAADFNTDSQVNVQDATLILRKIVGLS